MKLQSELKGLISNLKSKVTEESINKHIEAVRSECKSLRVRVIYDVCRYACGGSVVMCEWYDKYNCHDEHIKTLFFAAFREVFSSIYEDKLTY